MSSKTKDKKDQLPLNLNFEQLEVSPPEAAHLPSLLSLSPFFKPTSSRKKSDTQGWDDNDGESFQVENIEWIRFGPGLDTYDLETLIAVIQLVNVTAKVSRSNFQIIENALTNGSSRKAPSAFEDIGIDDDLLIRGEERVTKQFGVTTPTAINRYIGRSIDAESLEFTRSSVRRLGNTTSKFINHKSGVTLYPVPFFAVRENRSGAFVISFPPEMSFVLAKFMEFNLKLYRQLTSVGQAMMLWMNATSGTVTLTLEDARIKTQFDGPLKEFKRALMVGRPDRNIMPVLGQMIELGFLKRGFISGTGRKIPFLLEFERK